MAQVSFKMNYMDGLDIKSVIHNLEIVGYVYDDSEPIYDGTQGHYFYNDMFTLQIYSDKEGAVNLVEIRKFSIVGNRNSDQEGICTTNKLDNGVFLIEDVLIEGVLEILYTTPNDEVIDELRKLSIEKTLEPLNG